VDRRVVEHRRRVRQRGGDGAGGGGPRGCHAMRGGGCARRCGMPRAWGSQVRGVRRRGEGIWGGEGGRWPAASQTGRQ
jgi:hypothetical protein